MTDEYKEQLLNYITNNVNKTDQTNNPFREQFIQYENNLNTFIEDGIYNELGLYSEFYISNFIHIEDNSNYLIYGDYWTSEHTRVLQGFFVVLDETLNPVQLLLKYDTGTLFRQFNALNIDEEGRLYGVDTLTVWSQDGQTSTKTRRFILLNNILTSNLIDGTYSVTLRNSYNLQYNNTEVYQVFKKIDSADYMMVGLNSDNSSKICVITLTINVGSENEWNRYNSNYTIQRNLWSYLIWEEETINLKIITSQIVNSTPKYLELIFNGTSFSVNLNYNLISLSDTATNNLIQSLIFKDIDEIYYQVGLFDIILKTNYNSSSYDIIYSNIDNENSVSIIFRNAKNNIFVAHSYFYYDEDFEFHNLVKFGLINGDNVYFSDEIDINYSVGNLFGEELFIVKNSYNLNELCLQGKNKMLFLPVDFNILNYNGDTYKDYKMLKANKMTLYNNERLIFSRNLYNKTIIGNSTTSITEVPNTMLNNIEINKENLISETNLDLTTNDMIITKNIYENLFFNFTNNINVIDEDKEISYPNTANFINNNINTGTQINFENTTCSKFRINYADETTKVSQLEWLPINKFNKTTNISLYIDKEVVSLDLISNDEQTIYLTIDISNMEVGSYCNITQKIRTGNKPKLTNLKYNNQDINYNNEPIMVYIEE